MLQGAVVDSTHSKAKDPISGLDQAQIREQLQKILESPLFNTSKRYPTVLRYLVDRTLEKSHEPLKERTIGVDVLGRDPDYDTNEDPTVRVVAGEIRKRLLTYYREPSHAAQIRIELPVGSYTPKFSAGEPVVTAKSTRRRPLFWALITALSAALAFFAGYLVMPSQSALDRFWRPILRDSPSVLMCVGEKIAWGAPPRLDDPMAPEIPSTPSEDGATPNSLRQFFSAQPAFSLMSMTAVSNIAAYLHPRSKMIIRAAGVTNLADLRQGPAILIGTFTNYWTIHVDESLRFHFRRSNEEAVSWIEDKDNLSKRDWAVNLNARYTDVTADYAIITRVKDPSTGQIVVAIGGVTPIATVAASEFLVNPTGWEALTRQAPRGWEQKNLQIVIGVNVINGKAGAPRVLATSFW
jgi:hypothetical protein